MPRPPRTTPTPDTAPGGDAAEGATEKGVSVDDIAQDIATAIVEKRLPPGTWLREEALGRVYAVSRTKIRAALLTLAKDKLVETVPDKGSFVCQPSVQEAREVFAVRRLLESEVVRLVVARATAQDYQRLEKHIRAERSALHTPASGAAREKLLGDFHVALAQTSGNKVLTDLVTELVARSSLIAMLYQSHNDPHCSIDEHTHFLQMCRVGDADAAAAEMLAHLHRIEASLRLEEGRRDRQLDLVKALLT